MDHKQRHKRVRLLVNKANKERKKQALKIDILCNDLIAAQKDFIKILNTVSFKANFYESIVGIADLNNLLHTTCKLIKYKIPDANIAFFLRQQESFKLHTFDNNNAETAEEQRLETYFTAEIVNSICKLNKLCVIDDMFAMGLQGNPAFLSKISAVTIPLGQFGPPLGFILIYRSSENKLTSDELNNISAATCGLSRAIQFCQVPSRTAD